MDPFAFNPNGLPPQDPSLIGARVYTTAEKVRAWVLFSVCMAVLMGLFVAVEEGVFASSSTSHASIVLDQATRDAQTVDYQIGYDAGVALASGNTAYGAIFDRDQGSNICGMVVSQYQRSNRTSQVQSLPLWTKGCKAAMTDTFRS